VTKAYRTIIDFIYAAKKRDTKFKIELAKLKQELNEKLDTVYHRGSSSGFFLGKPINEWAGCSGSQATQKKIYIGKILHYYNKIKVAEILIQGNTKVKVGASLLIQGPTTGSVEETIISLEKDHKAIKETKAGDRVAIGVKSVVRKNDQVYVIEKNN
jgi:putative protease